MEANCCVFSTHSHKIQFAATESQCVINRKLSSYPVSHTSDLIAFESRSLCLYKINCEEEMHALPSSLYVVVLSEEAT